MIRARFIGGPCDGIERVLAGGPGKVEFKKIALNEVTVLEYVYIDADPKGVALFIYQGVAA